MVLARPRAWSAWGRTRTTAVAVALVAVVIAGGATFLGASAPSTSAAAPVAAHPTAASAPTIYYFFASPNEFFEGGSTDLFVGTSSSTPDFTYYNLPPGCFSSDSSFLFCQPTGWGFYNVTVAVTNGGSGPAALDYATIAIEPVVEGNFYSLNTSVATWASNSSYQCSSVSSPPFYQEFCNPQVQSPSLLPLPNGTIGLAYQQETRTTANTCAGPNATVARVEFQLSNDTGATWGNATDLGNDTCAYLNAIEPAFTATNDTIYGAFVEENSSALPWNYTSRPGDAIGFVASTDGGLNWSTVKTVHSGAGNLSRPAIAAVGSTIYLFYEDIANGTTTIGGGVLPISIWYQVSTDGGSHWTTAKRLAGLNSAERYTAASPAAAVSPDGSVTVAYATDRVCESGVASNCSAWADSIVASTSTNNGSSWSSPSVVATGAVETACFSGACEPGYYQSTPEIALAYAPVGGELYLAYAAAYDQGASVADNFNHTGLFGAESSDDGATWTSGAINAAPGASSLRDFDPGLAASSTTVYLTYLEANETAGIYGFANSLSDFVRTLPVGNVSGWSPPTATDIQSFATGGSVNATRGSFAGYSASVAVNATGEPLIAFEMPGSQFSTISRAPGYYYANSSNPSQIVVGSFLQPTNASALQETFEESGIPAGVNWSFTLDGLWFVLPVPAIEFLNVPANEPAIFGAYFAVGYWEIDQSYFNATESEFYYSTTTTYSFSIWVGLEIGIYPNPLNGPAWSYDPYQYTYIYANMYNSPFPAYAYASDQLEGEYICNPTCGAAEYDYWEYESNLAFDFDQCTNTIFCNWPTPWYFPLGSTVQVVIDEWIFFGLSPVYWTGQGAGSYTGASQGYCYYSFYCDAYGTMTMDGPINETIWQATGPADLSANLTVSATGLPSTSVYSFDLGGASYSANATQAVAIDNAAPGAYDVTDIQATAPTAGWEYFGSVNGPNPFLSPLQTAVNLTFSALVDVAAPSGTISFHAPALTAGTYWSIVFNGTTYASTTPWINVTGHPGTYPYSVGISTSPDGTAGYVPTSTGTTISVTTGQTYTVGFSPAYLVRAIASPGGLVSINGGNPASEATAWVASGASVSLSSEIAAGYVFDGWSGTGTGSYSGNATSSSAVANAPIVESAAFVPLPGQRFNLTFVETGLPSGTWWSVELGGAGQSSDATSLSIGNLWPWTAAGSLGQYSLSVPDVYLNDTTLTRYVATGYPAVVGTNGTFTPYVLLSFSAQSLLQLDALQGGVVEGTYAGAPTGSSAWIPNGGTVSLVASPNPGYNFAGWIGTGNGSYTGANASATVLVGGPISEVATFSAQVTQAPTRYSLTFNVTTPLAAGTVWTIDVGGVGYSSDGSQLTVSGLLEGNYGISIGTTTSPSGTVQYRPTSTDPASYTVTGNRSLDIGFDDYYWVSVSAASGGTVSPGDGYYAAGSVLYLVATPGVGDTFEGWSGSGDGNYTGSNTTASLLVLGPLNETADFRSVSSGAVASSVWSSPETWIGIGAVALIAGLVVGLVYARLAPASGSRKGPAPAPTGRSSATGQGDGR